MGQMLFSYVFTDLGGTARVLLNSSGDYFIVILILSMSAVCIKG